MKNSIINMGLNFFNATEGDFYYFWIPSINTKQGFYMQPAYYVRSEKRAREFLGNNSWYLSESYSKGKSYKQELKRCYVLNLEEYLVNMAKYRIFALNSFAGVHKVVAFYLYRQKQELLKMGVGIDELQKFSVQRAVNRIELIKKYGPCCEQDKKLWETISRNLKNPDLKNFMETICEMFGTMDFGLFEDETVKQRAA